MPVIVKPGKGYMPPLPGDIKKHLGDEYKESVIRDVANALNGGEFNTNFVDEYQEEFKKFHPYQSKYKLPSGHYTTNRDIAASSAALEAAGHLQTFRRFLKSVRINDIPGESIWEKSVNFIKAMQENGMDVQGMPGGGGYGVIDSPNQAANAIQKLRELARPDALSKALARLIATGVVTTDKAYQMKKTANLLKGKTTYTVHSNVTPQDDPEGEEIEYRSIKHIGELKKATGRFWTYPDRYAKYLALTNQATVKVKVRHVADKQLMILLVDCSGSMSGDRTIKAAGVIYDRLLAVMEGKAELYVGTFDDKLNKKIWHVKTEEEAQELLAHIAGGKHFTGGGTRIQNSAIKAIEQIDTDDVRRKELIVVSDGEDRIDRPAFLRFLSERHYKLHMVQIEHQNSELNIVARMTGGAGFLID